MRCPRCMRRGILPCSCVPSVDGGYRQDDDGFARFCFWLAFISMILWGVFVILRDGL